MTTIEIGGIKMQFPTREDFEHWATHPEEVLQGATVLHEVVERGEDGEVKGYAVIIENNGTDYIHLDPVIDKYSRSRIFHLQPEKFKDATMTEEASFITDFTWKRSGVVFRLN